MSYRDCFDCFRLRPDRCDRHSAPAATATCFDCENPMSTRTAVVVRGQWLCPDCAEEALGDLDYEDLDYGPADSDDPPDRDEWEPGGSRFDRPDTPNLEDSNPELYGYAHNKNPWGMEGGY